MKKSGGSIDILDEKYYPELVGKGFKIADLLGSKSSELVDGIVKAYKDVFNNSAWGEGVKCREGCGFKSTIEESPETCPNCQGRIVDFYSDQEVKDVISDVLEKTGYKQFLVLLDSKMNVGGFTWGWNTTLQELNTEKLGLDSSEYTELQKGLSDKGIGPDQLFYYQSETGIIGDNRGEGLGSDLISLNQEILENNKDKVEKIIQRTSKGSPMYNIRKKQGYTPVYEYGDREDRVIFAKNNS